MRFLLRSTTVAAMLISGCDVDSDPGTTNTTETLQADTDDDTDANPCHAPLVRLQTGPDPTCAGEGNEHEWPVGMDSEDCHGWSATDPQGEEHLNSANDIRCEADGSFSFTQFAGTLDCSGTGVTKKYRLNICEQDTPPVLYTQAVDLTCCESPSSPECVTGAPTITVPGGMTYLNSASCKP
jgi:hypothetical protein